MSTDSVAIKLVELSDKIESQMDRSDEKGGKYIAISLDECMELVIVMRDAAIFRRMAKRRLTPRVSGAAVSRPLDPLVMRFINKEELMTGNEDFSVQFGEDPPWDDLPPVDREKANKELESRLIFDSWTCRFCGGTFADRTLAIKHAIDCDDNEDVHSCATCASYEIGEDTRDGYRHICKGNPKRIDTWMKHCPEWIGA